MLDFNPMPSYSKAPRGLFVPPRVMSIFTHTSISPSPSLRHCPGRYTFHAGRNLPDKGFRYLRTVRVTAVVHRGFSSKLSLLPLTFRHWTGISPYTSAFALAGTCDLVKQSPGPFHCGLIFSEAPLLPKLRGQIAEFLNEGSLDHLRMFVPTHQCRFAVRTLTFSSFGFSRQSGPGKVISGFPSTSPTPFRGQGHTMSNRHALPASLCHLAFKRK